MVEEGELSDKSISNHLKAIKSLFKHAYDEEVIITTNPMERVKFTPGDGEQIPPFSPQERAAIFAACKTAEPFLKWFNLLGLFGGMRNSEILRAKKEV